MKNRFPFWILIGVVLSTAIGIASGNFRAGLFMGTGIAMLLMIITNLEVERKIRN